MVFLLVAIAYVAATGHTNYKYGYSIKGKYGAGQVEAGGCLYCWHLGYMTDDTCLLRCG